MALLSLIGPATKLIGKFIEDKDAKNKRAHEVATMAEKPAQELSKGQLEINKAEAQSRNIFVAGWRPFVGWTCGLALFYTYLVQPIAIFGMGQTGNLVHLPPLDLSTMMPVLLGMLGLGGLRSWEKYKKLAR